MINQKLLAARKEKGWSIEVASARVGVGRVTYSRWENGHQEPQPAVLKMLCKAFEMSARDLGYGHLSKRLEQSDRQERQVSDIHQNPLASVTESQLIDFTALRRLQETLMHDPEKRKTLQTLLTIMGMVMVQPQALLQPESWQPLLTDKIAVKPNESTLQGFERLIEACWQLSRGNELALAEKLLPECMTRLVPLAQQPSQYQQAAASLAAQGFRLYNILALHRNDLLAKEFYCKQAIQYSSLSGNQNLLIASLKGLASTYYYREQYLQVLQIHLKALQYAKEASPLLQACIHMGLAVAYAHLDQKQNSFNSLSLALDAFPDHPETDPSFSHADFDHAQMIFWEGLTRSKLGQAKRALDIFKRIEQPNILVPERIRIEIFNQQAKTAIVSGDVEQGSSYIEAGVTGAKMIGSQRRYNEAYENFKQMRMLWPQEHAVRNLVDLFSPIT